MSFLPEKQTMYKKDNVSCFNLFEISVSNEPAKDKQYAVVCNDKVIDLC